MPEEPLIQRYWYKGNHPERPILVTRSYSKNARKPTPAQAEQRLRITDIAKMAKGMKMEEGDELPPVAKLVKQFASEPTGMELKERVPVWKRELDEYLNIRLGEVEDKDRQIEEIFELLEGIGV